MLKGFFLIILFIKTLNPNQFDMVISLFRKSRKESRKENSPVWMRVCGSSCVTYNEAVDRRVEPVSQPLERSPTLLRTTPTSSPTVYTSNVSVNHQQPVIFITPIFSRRRVNNSSSYPQLSILQKLTNSLLSDQYFIENFVRKTEPL